ncbi:hypothetical protein T492DRAFT_994179, partial [Pavlovales sp. CCMP2436]
SGCLAKLLYALLSATSITDARALHARTSSRHSKLKPAIKWTCSSSTSRLLRLPLQPVLPPRPRSAARALHAQTSSRHSKPYRFAAIRHRWWPRVAQRLHRFVFGFLIIHHFYQLPTAA